MKYLSLAIMLALCGCSSGEPSASDIQQAMQAVERLNRVESVEQVNCVDASEGRYRCSFKMTARAGQRVRDLEVSRLFEKHPSGWIIAGK